MLTEPVQAKALGAESKQEGQKHSEEGREMFHRVRAPIRLEHDLELSAPTLSWTVW